MSKFEVIEFFERAPESNYQLLPFSFDRLEGEKYILTNQAGEYITMDRVYLDQFVNKKLSSLSPQYIKLRSRQFLLDETNSVAPELLSLKVRTKYSRLSEFTSLHIFVVTLRCEHSCPYCQVSRQSEDKNSFDMSAEIALKSLDMVFKSPAQSVKIEFQGGEPLLNFELIKFVVLEAKKRNIEFKKNLGFVIATNLALINREILLFCKGHEVSISTSLDGPQDLHNHNRPRPGKNSYEKAIEGIRLTREILGKYSVSALMTTTEASLSRPIEIIDEYLSQGFNGVFLRSLSPYGFAIKTKTYRAYKTNEWLEFYRKGLDYIIQLNKQGIPFQEYYATTILIKMLTSREPGYVDLMSPSGMGIAAVVYNYDGTVHPSDESRMLAEMGDKTFQMGNVLTDTYDQIFTSDALLNPLEESITKSVPMCHECAFESYCGSEPVYHHAIQRDFVGRKAESDFCSKNMAIFKLLIGKMEKDPYVKSLFEQWANKT